MGKEISTLPELNQFEAINHKSQIRLWLHDVVDGVVTPGLLTVENLIAGVNLGLDNLYAASDHDHDSAYSAITHNHDADYADIAHNHDSTYATLTEAAKHLAYSHAEWAGEVTSAAQRQINLVGDVTYAKFALTLAYDIATENNVFLGLWSTGYGDNSVGLRWGTGWTPYYFVNLNTFYTNSAPDATAGIFHLYSEHWNYSGLSYRGFVWGVR